MLRTDLMIRTNDTALKQAPDPFDGVRVNVSTDPLFGAVVNGLVGCVAIGNSAISWVLISHQPFCSRLCSVFDECVKYLPVSLLSALNPEADRAAAFNGSKNHCLIVQIAATDITLLSAHIGLVDLYNALQLRFRNLQDGA